MSRKTIAALLVTAGGGLLTLAAALIHPIAGIALAGVLLALAGLFAVDVK